MLLSYTPAFWESLGNRAGMVRKNRCCIATVRVDDFPGPIVIVNSLFQIMSLVLPSLACRLRVQMR